MKPRAKRAAAGRKHPTVPLLASFVVFGGRDETHFLTLAASLACAAGHPLGAAIRRSPPEPGLNLQNVKHLRVFADQGAVGFVGGLEVALGNARLFELLGLSLGDLGDWAARLDLQRQQVLFLAVSGTTIGFCAVSHSNDLRKRRLHPQKGEQQ